MLSAKLEKERQGGRHPQPTARKRPQDPGFWAEGFQLEHREDDLK